MCSVSPKRILKNGSFHLIQQKWKILAMFCNYDSLIVAHVTKSLGLVIRFDSEIIFDLETNFSIQTVQRFSLNYDWQEEDNLFKTILYAITLVYV